MKKEAVEEIMSLYIDYSVNADEHGDKHPLLVIDADDKERSLTYDAVIHQYSLEIKVIHDPFDEKENWLFIPYENIKFITIIEYKNVRQ